MISSLKIGQKTPNLLKKISFGRYRIRHGEAKIPQQISHINLGEEHLTTREVLPSVGLIEKIEEIGIRML